MELLSVSVEGYKRFRTRTSLQTNGKLVAVLGPNEAGKSTLLSAMAHLTYNGAFEPSEVSRDMALEDCSVEGRFHLAADEAEIGGLIGPHTMIVRKKGGVARRTVSFDPPPPDRGIGHRPTFLALVDENSELEEDLSVCATELDLNLSEILAPVRTHTANLDVPAIDRLQALLNRSREYFEEDADNATPFLDSLAKLIELERAPTPIQYAIDNLYTRIPKFLFFDEEARSLQSDYLISNLRDGAPIALANLLEVAEFSLDDLFAAIDADQTSRITTLERRANRVLGQKFKAVWRQSGIEAAIRIHNNRLEVQIVDPDDEHTAIAERSDGLKQFLALQAFSMCNRADNPILLIDEAEQRLHYDAQADLVQMLAKQSVSPKVIYTTHSAGCLPEDLGNGVRLVTPVGETSSKIVNRFWRGEAANTGLSPLLIGMGAGTLAFFPTRRAVMVEGPGDMLLYPTLFREVLGRASLGFQFVPGLSNIQRTMKPEALKEEVGLVYLVDGDIGGLRIATRLKRRGGVADEDIFVARCGEDALEVEDFISPDRLAEAANSHLQKWHSEASLIIAADLDKPRRLLALEAAFLASTGLPLPKVDIAYELLDQVNNMPSTELVDAQYRTTLANIAANIVDRLERSIRPEELAGR